MGREEQTEEREVLASIFPDEMQDLSGDQFAISIDLDIRLASTEEQAPAIKLLVQYPEQYPDVAPSLHIEYVNDAQIVHLSLPEDEMVLLAALEETVTDSLGTPMIFSLTSVLKEATENLIQDRMQAVVEVQNQQARAAEAAENAKFHGDKVTKERFLAWRAAFQEEARVQAEVEATKADDEASKGRKIRLEEPKLTGKQLWEQGLAGKPEDEEGDLLAVESLELT